MIRRALLAATVILVGSAAGCDSGPEKLTFDKPLPACDAFVETLTGLGMPAPGPATTEPPASPDPLSVKCTWAPPTGTKPPAVAYAYIYLLRPNFDSSDGDALPDWAKDGATAECEGTPSTDAALPSGQSCYALRNEQEASMEVSAYAEKTAVSVILHWADNDATPDQLRTRTLDKANALANAAIGLL